MGLQPGAHPLIGFIRYVVPYGLTMRAYWKIPET
jgi:hypothetical protein